MRSPFATCEFGDRRRRSHPPAGYTLLELVTAVVIIGLIASAGAPRFAAAIGAQQASAAARRLAADLEWLRSTARITSQSQTVSFDTAGNTYTLLAFADPDHPGKPYKVVLPGGLCSAGFVSVNLGGPVGPTGTTTLTFNGFGVPLSGGSVVLRAGKTTRTITIDATTGIATWQ
ncbi:MAG TPA: GspH/FimT family protein [Pirellulales bacterium]|jgi:prepilin-type N-terminal cleavage/methylation domain-containing protein|nr:GspH/FimT family protein [Pirellulales bacterium]